MQASLGLCMKPYAGKRADEWDLSPIGPLSLTVRQHNPLRRHDAKPSRQRRKFMGRMRLSWPGSFSLVVATANIGECSMKPVDTGRFLHTTTPSSTPICPRIDRYGVDGGPLLVQTSPPLPYRFVLLRLRGSSYLHLEEVEVRGRPT
jgi:hypothetical protein